MMTPAPKLAKLPRKNEGVLVMAAKVYNRKDRGIYYIQLSWKGKKYRRTHYDNEVNFGKYREMAEQIASAINADIKKKGKLFDPRQWFKTPGYEFEFNVYADKWLKENTHYAPRVMHDVSRYVGLFTDYFGKTDLREIRKVDIKDAVKSLPETWSPKTVNNALIVLHKMLADAVDDEMLPKMPAFPKVTVSKPEVKWITREWQDKIINEIAGRDRPIFLFLRSWGCRPGEARALMWDCVDFEQEVITIKRTFQGAGCNYLKETTKTGRIRYLPFTDELRDVFNEIRGISGFVFRNRQGRPYTSDISRIWAEAREKVGCPVEVTLNQGTRHSFATQHLDQLPIVSRVLGHTEYRTTQERYEGINLEAIRGLLGGNRGPNSKNRTIPIKSSS